MREPLLPHPSSRCYVCPSMTNSKPMQTWRLKSGADRRFRSGHPWVYSNELAASPAGIEPGAPIELCDAGGKFLARGYGNPHSLIAFRVLSRNPAVAEPLAAGEIAKVLLEALALRLSMGFGKTSFRLCFGEADGLPGLVIDRYRLASSQVFVVQAHTAGMDRILPEIEKILEKVTQSLAGAGEPAWERTGIVIRNDLGVRKLEGIEEQAPRVLRDLSGVSLMEAKILVRAAGSGSPLEFQVDLLKGQKTGFFLDQAGNVELAVTRLKSLRPKNAQEPLRILDLCTYVGQWGAQLARAFHGQGVPVEVTAVDASAQALEFARRNIEAEGGVCTLLRGDVLKDLETLTSSSFDLVISDPPALIKGRKDVPAGTHAYLQLNTQVFRLVRPGGAVVCCSCSGLLEEESFIQTLSKAAYRNRRSVRWIARGGQSSDHPALLEFPEGRYLKAWIGFASRNES